MYSTSDVLEFPDLSEFYLKKRRKEGVMELVERRERWKEGKQNNVD